MRLLLSVFPLCLGFMAPREYPFLFHIFLEPTFVPGQNTSRVCAAIELVEEQFYLLPKVCFDQPTKNGELKARVSRRKSLSFKPLIYKSFISRWEYFSDYAILDRYDDDDQIFKATAGDIELNMSNVNTTLPTPSEDIIKESRRYMEYSFRDSASSGHKKKRQEQTFIRLPPNLEDEDKLPPRVMLTVPNSPLLTDCFILGYGTFFETKNENSTDQFEGLELRRVNVSSIKPGVSGSEYSFSTIWFEREKGISYNEDLGSPMICNTKNRNVSVIIGLFVGGNDTLNHEFDSYRSFMGEFFYITHWAIGTNVSLTGDPAVWTLWPVAFHEQPKSKSVLLQFDKILSLIIFIYFMIYNLEINIQVDS